MAAAETLRELIDRILRLKEEIKGLQEDVKTVYAEGKVQGFDTHAMREIVRISGLKLEDYQAHEQTVAQYLASLGMI